MAVLLSYLPWGARALEIASGTGEHAVHMAAARPDIHWQPSDPDPESRASIAAWIEYTGLLNVASPLDLDTRRQPWPADTADLILCCNMIHIAPWESAVALVEGAGRVLSGTGVLFLYGPYKREGRHTAPSNEVFDESLRSCDPAWGIRDLEAVTALAADNGFTFVEAVPMPANNFSVIFRKG